MRANTHTLTHSHAYTNTRTHTHARTPRSMDEFEENLERDDQVSELDVRLLQKFVRVTESTANKESTRERGWSEARKTAAHL